MPIRKDIGADAAFFAAAFSAFASALALRTSGSGLGFALM